MLNALQVYFCNYEKIFYLLIFYFNDSESEAQSRLKEHNSIGWYTTTITPAISKNKLACRISMAQEQHRYRLAAEPAALRCKL